MKYIIAGASGFIGSALYRHFNDQGIECILIGRNKNNLKKQFGHKSHILNWDEFDQQGLEIIRQANVVINLCGANIGDKRWSANQKNTIIQSRVSTTEKIANLLAKIGKDAPPLFNASAIGIYGRQNSQRDTLPNPVSEETPIEPNTDNDFLATVGRLWEHATSKAKESGVRVVNLRFAVVLGPNGGALGKIAMPFYFFIGGPIGDGQQAFSWITLADVIAAIDFLITHPEITGPVNLVSPQCIMQKQLASSIGQTLNRPSFWPNPAILLKLVFGQMAEELLLSGQHITPEVLTQHGFTFKYPDIQSALKYALSSSKS